MKIISGNEIIENSFNDLKKKYEKLCKIKKRKAIFTMIAIEPNEASKSYIKAKENFCKKLDIKTNTIILDENYSQEEVIELIKKLNEDELITAILVQMPINKKYDEIKILETIDYKKDVDSLTSTNFGKLILNTPRFIPCTANAVIKILDYIKQEVEGLDIIIIGRSNIVGKPLANLLINKGATVQICNSKTKNLKEKIYNSDIVISATGVKNLIKSDYVKKDSILIDVGITRENDKLYGDFDFENIVLDNKAKYITKVPGGVGPLTVLSLMENIIKAFEGEENEK